MSRRQRAAPKVQVSSSVRLGLESIIDGNERALRSMLDASASDDLVEKLIDVMGVSNINAEMLLANYFSASMLSTYSARLGKSDKGGTATLAERIAREWAKPSFTPPSSTGKKRSADADEEDGEEVIAQKRLSALEEIKAKRAKQAAAKQQQQQQSATQAAAATSSASAAAATDATPTPPKAQVLFYYHCEAHSVSVIELKRPEYKGIGDFARYCSWFFVEAGSAMKLTFESWDRENGMRTFKEGVLRRNPDNWVTLIPESPLPNQIALTSTASADLPSTILEECLRVWGA